MIDTIFGRTPAVRRAQARGANALLQLRLTPDRATALGLALGIAAGVALGAGAAITGLVLLVFSALIDALDGTIAREYGSATVIGGIFDLCADRIVEVAAIMGIAWQRPELYFPALVLVASWYINITVFLATGAALEPGEKLIAYPPGLVERTEAIIFFVILVLIRPFGLWLCYAFTTLELITAAQRGAYAVRNLKRGRAGKST